MKTLVLIIIGIIILGVAVASIIWIQEYQSAYNQDCTSKDGKIVGFLRCVKTHEDFALPNPFIINLKFGETFQHEGFEIKFFDIEDSRCPLDVTCVWEGHVTAMFKVSNQTHDISSGRIPIGFTIDFITPYEITLNNIEPYPVSTEKPDYVATLEITKLVNPPDNRESLKEVVYSNTDCAKFWRAELFDMWDNQDYDYRNDPIFIECSNALETQSEKISEVTGSYELDEVLCLGGRNMILNEKCERIGKYDIQTGIPTVENKVECDLLNGTWYDEQNKCDSKYAPVEYRFQFGYSFLGYEKPQICTDDMMRHLAIYSNMFVDEEERYSLEWIGLGENINSDDFDACENELLKLR